MLVPDAPGIPPLRVAFGPVRVVLYEDGPVVLPEPRGAAPEAAAAVDPNGLMALAGLLAGIADLYRHKQEPRS
jgi:hypothetical protein